MTTNPVIWLFLALGIVIVAARVAGTIARRFDQPRVLGELIVGVILGPTLIDILNNPALGLQEAHLGETIHELAELGVLLLMFKIGLDVHIKELVKVGHVAVTAGFGGELVTVVLIVPVAMLSGYTWEPALFAGVALAATSVSISAQVLLELGVLRTKEGNALLATALIDDMIAILLGSLAFAIASPQGTVEGGTLALIVTRMALYVVIALLVAWFALPRLVNWVHTHPEAGHAYGVPALALTMALFFGWSAEQFGGAAAIIGAFIAGVGLSRARETVRHEIDAAVSNISYAFLVPIFFVNVGLRVDLSVFPLGALPFAALLLVIVVAAKVFGSGLGAYLTGFNRLESLRLGVCMIPRGEVGLIIASLGLSSGVFQPTDPLFASLFLIIVLSTVITPPLVRRVFQAPKAQVAEGSAQ